jgi:hypothetical protein
MFLALLYSSSASTATSFQQGFLSRDSTCGVPFSLPFTTLQCCNVLAFSECISAIGWLIRPFMMDMLASTNRVRLIFVSSNVLEG